MISLKKSHLEMYFDVLHETDATVYALGSDLRLVSLGPIVSQASIIHQLVKANLQKVFSVNIMYLCCINY